MRACQHIFDKTLVTRNVDETKANVTQLKVSKPQVDGYAAAFFFRKSVGVSSSQCANERAFAMINVTGCANYYGAHVVFVGLGELVRCPESDTKR
jgi:hypothetical protein